MLNTTPHSAKQDAIRILNSLNDSDNFEEILYQMYVRKKIEQGLADSREGNIVPEDEMARFWQRWAAK
jgi:hypothetical protein